MSAGLEVAAGAFAVVGVVDVLLKTSRQVYEFLGEISDAPQNLRSLCTLLDQTIVLVSDTRQSLESLQSCIGLSPDVPKSLAGAIRAVDRQVQDLKRSVTKITGEKKWTKIKFVLDQKKISKAVDNLGRLNSLLASTLLHGSRQENVLYHRRTEATLAQGFQKSHERTDHLKFAMATAENSIVNQMRINTRQVVRNQSSNRRIIVSKIDKQELLSQQVVVGQQQSLRTMTELRKDSELCSIRQRQTHALVQALADKVQILHFTSRQSGVSLGRQARNITFLGHRPDRIISYLMPLQDKLDEAVRSLISIHGNEISMSHIEWLQDEVEYLMSSAAQEQARISPGSTAKPFDRWIYAGNKIDFLRATTCKRKAPDIFDPNEDNAACQNVSCPPRKYRKKTQQTWPLKTESGMMYLRVPKCNEDRDCFLIDAHFVRDLTRAAQPRFYTHLNVFVQGENYTEYRKLASEGSIEDFDRALRGGAISLFHVDKDGNILLWSLVAYRRTDVLEYLENQGVALCSLDPDHVFTLGLLKYGHDSAPESDLAFIRKLTEKLDDATSVLASTALVALLDIFAIRYGALRNVRLLSYCMSSLGDSGFQWMEYNYLWHLDDISEYFGELAQKLLEEIAYPETILLERNILWYFVRMFVVCDGITSFFSFPRFVINVLSAMLDLKLDLHENGLVYGITISMYIRRAGNLWNTWCDVLIQNGMTIEEVVREEDKEWLLRPNFRDHWRELDIISYLRVGDETGDLSFRDEDLWLEVFQEPHMCP